MVKTVKDVDVKWAKNYCKFSGAKEPKKVIKEKDLSKRCGDLVSKQYREFV